MLRPRPPRPEDEDLHDLREYELCVRCDYWPAVAGRLLCQVCARARRAMAPAK